MMYDAAAHFSWSRGRLFNPVSGSVASMVLVAFTILLLAAGCWIFTRSEYIDVG